MMRTLQPVAQGRQRTVAALHLLVNILSVRTVPHSGLSDAVLHYELDNRLPVTFFL